MIQIVTDRESIRSLCEETRKSEKKIALVPTMGALHDGHISLVDIARRNADFVVVSIFVNPTQFSPGEDFDKYPRMLEDDARKVGAAGANAVFAPDAVSMYRPGFATYVSVEGLTDGLCGRSRPNHFRGVTTIVTKLFSIMRPHCAVFGRKDAQQLAVIRRMTDDLDLAVEIIAAPIVRESDGLAMSSRNRYLSTEERTQATILSRSLMKARDMVMRGEKDSRAIIVSVSAMIGEAPLAVIDYVEIVDAYTMTPETTVTDRSLLAVAVKFGGTRLIDNMMLAGETL